MTMELIPPTLEDMGHTLWGSGWRKDLAEALEVDEDEIASWDAEPSKRPDDLQHKLERIGRLRVEVIDAMLAHMKEAGLVGTEPFQLRG